MKSSTGLITLASLASSALAALSITQPSSSIYFVQFSSNTIAWTSSQGDPAQVTLQIVNPNDTALNGAFSIAEYINASMETFTITNVALKVGEGYVVQMVNATNNTMVYTSSSSFAVMPTGTAPATGSGITNGTSNANSTVSTGSTNGTNATTTTTSANGTTVTLTNGTVLRSTSTHGSLASATHSAKSGASHIVNKQNVVGLLTGALVIAGLAVL